MREQILEYNSEHINLQRTGVSNKSQVASVVIAKDNLAPASPISVAASQVDAGIRLDWTNSTLNADGSTCTDMRWIAIYYKSTTGVTASNNDGKYILGGSAGDVQVYVDSIAASTERFYVITAIDTNGNESVESAEVTETSGNVRPTTDIPDDAAGVIFDDAYGADGVVIGDSMLGIIFKNPSSAWFRFDRYRLWFQYTDDNGVTWYDDDDVPDKWTEIPHVPRTGYVHKALNRSYGYRYKATVVGGDGTESSVADTAGGNTTKPDGANNNAIIATLVLAENITATNEVRGEHFYAQSYLAINSDTFGNDGIQLEYNGGDPRFYAGNGAVDVTGRYFNFDGTKITWKAANSELDASGNLTISNATVSGTITITGGSGIASLSDAGTLATADNLDDVDNGTTYGKIALTDISAGHITLVSPQAALNINNANFGEDGIQLQYNSGNPRAYFGDGANSFVSFDGTNLTWKAANSELDALGNLTATSVDLTGQLVAGTGSDVDVGYLTAGTILSQSIVLGVDAGQGDVEIRAGIASGDFANSGANSGFIIGIDDSDSDTAKFFFGDASDYIKWDGSTLTVRGDLGATTVSFTDLLPGTNTASLQIGGAGYIKSTNYSAGSDGFQIKGAGDAEFNDVTVRGKLIAGIDSSISVDYLEAGTITSQSINMVVAAGTGDVEIRSGIASGDFANSGSATGFILGVDDSDGDKAKFYFGSSSNHIQWTGSALTVQGGTITAGTFRTASSGERIELGPSSGSYNHYLLQYDGSGNIRTSMEYSYLKMLDSSGHPCALLYESTGEGVLTVALGGGGGSATLSSGSDSSTGPSLGFTYSGTGTISVSGYNGAHPVELQYASLRKRLGAASSPVDGLLAYADGSTWNPGSGEGAYMYYNSTWNYLG